MGERDSSTFRKRQYAFAAHIRDPENVPAPDDIEARRMAVYRDLFFNNLFSLLGTFFPVLRRIHDDTQWRRFIRGFMRQHEAQTPYFLQLPEEFLAYLQNEFEPAADDFPFLIELAHYEYAELELSVADAQNDPGEIDPDGDLLEGVPVKSCLAKAYAYQFPVHRISPDFLPREPAAQPVYLALYRDDDDEIGFLELNGVTAALLDAIGSNETMSGRMLLSRLADRIGYPDVDALVHHGAAALEDMRDRGILVGTRAGN
ncbi:MAG: putative DNA-binding domain-containing protein [Woeseiaceae bacterium]